MTETLLLPAPEHTDQQMLPENATADAAIVPETDFDHMQTVLKANEVAANENRQPEIRKAFQVEDLSGDAQEVDVHHQ